jgi:hypothetical protein
MEKKRGRPRIEPTPAARRAVTTALDSGKQGRIPIAEADEVSIRRTKTMLRRAADDIPARIRISVREDGMFFTVRPIGRKAA